MTEPAAKMCSRALLIFKIIAVCALLPLALAPFVYTGKVIAHFPYSIDREEAFLLQQAIDITKGVSIYHDVTVEPYTVGNYPPIYPFIFSVVLRAGVDGLAAGRLANLLSCAGIALCMGGIVFRQTRDWFAAAVAPMLFLATYEVQYWLPFARVDITALFFTALGLLLFTLSDNRKALIASLVAFVLAAYTKQTEILAPVACVFALLLSRRYRDAGILGGLFAGLCLIILLILNTATHGEFWKHTVTYNQNAMQLSLALPLWKHILRLYGAELLLCVVLVVFSFKALAASHQLRALGIFGILSLLSLVSISKVGSDVNYLLVPEIAVALLIGTLLPISKSRKSLCVVCYVLLGIHIVHTWMPGIHGIISKYPPDRSSRVSADAVLLAVNETKGEVLSEDAMYCIRDHRSVIYQPFIMTQLAAENKWDQTSFVSDLRRGRFALIVTMGCLGPDCAVLGFTQEMRDAILERYDEKSVVLLYPNQQRFLYVPKSTSEKP